VVPMFCPRSNLLYLLSYLRSGVLSFQFSTLRGCFVVLGGGIACTVKELCFGTVYFSVFFVCPYFDFFFLICIFFLVLFFVLLFLSFRFFGSFFDFSLFCHFLFLFFLFFSMKPFLLFFLFFLTLSVYLVVFFFSFPPI